MWEELIKSFILLFIIMDPFLSAIMFVQFSRKRTEKEVQKGLWIAIGVAAVLLFIFLFSGTFLLGILGINFDSFRIAGGIILLIMGIKTVLGIYFKQKKDDITSAAILIGTPMLSGPGTLTTIIILSKEYGDIIPAIAATAVLLVSYLLLKFSHHLERLLSSNIIEILSRILGLLLAAVAVGFITDGIRGLIIGG